MPNGTHAIEYNKAWCDERHRITDKTLEEQKRRTERTAESLELLRERFETRLDATERKLAVWGGIGGFVLVAIELVSKFFH